MKYNALLLIQQVRPWMPWCVYLSLCISVLHNPSLKTLKYVTYFPLIEKEILLSITNQQLFMFDIFVIGLNRCY